MDLENDDGMRAPVLASSAGAAGVRTTFRGGISGVTSPITGRGQGLICGFTKGFTRALYFLTCVWGQNVDFYGNWYKNIVTCIENKFFLGICCIIF